MVFVAGVRVVEFGSKRDACSYLVIEFRFRPSD